MLRHGSPALMDRQWRLEHFKSQTQKPDIKKSHILIRGSSQKWQRAKFCLFKINKSKYLGNPNGGYTFHWKIYLLEQFLRATKGFWF